MCAQRALTILALLLVGSLLGGTAFGAASSLLTSKDIKDGAIQNRDIKEGVITMSRLKQSTQDLINASGPSGPAGAPGAPGTPGVPGAPGGSVPTIPSSDFGIINRNTSGSPVAQLRNGPVAGSSHPPLGVGSMNMLVGSNEKLAVGISGNGQVAELDTVSLAVYTNGENSAQGATNMPNIQFEIDPNLASSTSNFATMTFVANNTSPGQWATVDATDPADGSWFLTGAAGTAIGCTQATTCSLADVKTKLNDGGDAATILTLMVNKGRDSAYWTGAVDALRVNNRVADFEVGGITVKDA